MIAQPGEIWLAGRGDETRRRVLVISDDRFHRLGERAIVAPVLDEAPAVPRPWHIQLGETTVAGVVAVNLLVSLPIDRLLDRVDRADIGVLRRVRRAAHMLVG
jgi:mRNA-degrading endonuclease toxin of MazEF toxin-antitoxin module